MAERVNICPLCEEVFRGMGRNGEPLTHKRVCDDCDGAVIAARLADLKRRGA